MAKKAKRKAAKRNPKRRKSHAKRSNPKRHKARASHAKRSNPKRRRHHHAKRSNPRRRHARRRNPAMGETAMRVVKGVGGGLLAAGAAYGTVRAMQKFPAKSKAGALAMQAGALVVGGGALSAISPVAGGVYAATIGSAMIATAQAPSSPPVQTPAATPPATQGLIAGRVQGLLPQGVDRTDPYDVAMRSKMNGLIAQNLRHAR